MTQFTDFSYILCLPVKVKEKMPYDSEDYQKEPCPRCNEDIWVGNLVREKRNKLKEKARIRCIVCAVSEARELENEVEIIPLYKAEH